MMKRSVNLPFFDRYFLKARQIFLWGEIDDKLAMHVVQSLRYLASLDSNKDIEIYIHSEGGCVESTMAIIDEMLKIKEQLTIQTICQSQAYSSAAFVLALGTEGYRKATANSSMMLHQVTYETAEDNARVQKQLTDFSLKQIENIYDMVGVACKQTTPTKKKKFRADIENTIWMDPKEAKRFGLIDEILGK